MNYEISTFASWVLIAAPIQLWSLNTPLFKQNNSLCNKFLFEKQRIIWENKNSINGGLADWVPQPRAELFCLKNLAELKATSPPPFTEVRHFDPRKIWTLRDRWRYENGWIFRKVPNGLWPPPPPPLDFGKSCCIFFGKCPKKALLKGPSSAA